MIPIVWIILHLSRVSLLRVFPSDLLPGGAIVREIGDAEMPGHPECMLTADCFGVTVDLTKRGVFPI